MASIKLKDLAVHGIAKADLLTNSGSIRELSESELVLQGGKRRSPAPMLPPPILSDWPTPVDPFIPPHLPGFYI